MALVFRSLTVVSAALQSPPRLTQNGSGGRKPAPRPRSERGRLARVFSRPSASTPADKTIRQPNACISQRRRERFPLLPGEKAGMRAVVPPTIPNFVNTKPPCRPRSVWCLAVGIWSFSIVSAALQPDPRPAAAGRGNCNENFPSR